MRKMIMIAAAIAAAAAGTAGCGSGAPARPPTMQEALQQSGCANMKNLYHGEMFTTASADCTLNGTPAEIAIFPGPASQKQWEQFVKIEGAVILKDGPDWTVSSK